MTASPPTGVPRASVRASGWLLAGMLVLLPLHTAHAWQQTTPPPRPAPVYVPPPPSQQFKQSMRQQQLRDQLQKNQLEEQLRQGSVETMKRPTATDQAHTRQLDQANRAQSDLYRARQQDVIDRYRSTPVPPPAAARSSHPAPARSGG